MRNIVLIGFMGTGKSVIGQKLAKELGMKYVSTDDMIEAKDGRSINEIFANDGEAYFRRMEKDAVRKASGMENAVIAAGGGAVLDEENMRNLSKNGSSICLSATAREILERTKGYAHRPLLNVADPLAEIKRMLKSRAPYYAKADYTVDTTGKKIDEIVKEIIKIV